MDSLYPIRTVIVSSDILNAIISDLKREINSKRCQSKIHSISDLIIVLYKRNVIDRNNYSTILQNVLHVCSNDDKLKIKDFVHSLDHHSDSVNTNTNQYGEPCLTRGVMDTSDIEIIRFQFKFYSSSAKTSSYKIN